MPRSLPCTIPIDVAAKRAAVVGHPPIFVAYKQMLRDVDVEGRRLCAS
jgi:hypothetical protein